MVVNQNKLQLKQVHIKNFRCFTQTNLELYGDIVLIQGDNGSGKTSLLEALHYLCYLRSFRTHSPRDLVQLGNSSFFIKATFDSHEFDQVMNHEIQVGFSGKKRLVKVDQKSVASYKDLMQYYRILTLTEDDLKLINQGPEERRAFLDQAILLDDPEFIGLIRNFRTIVDSRNALLAQGIRDQDSFKMWTIQLFNASRAIQERRVAMLDNLERQTNAMLTKYFDGQIAISGSYNSKKISLDVSIDAVLEGASLLNEESRFGRSLFGAHLDDISIKFQAKNSRVFASRGQQKLIVLMLKMAFIKYLDSKKGAPVFLLDDFMTDFDENRAEILLAILQDLGSQLIFTSPSKGGFFEEKLISLGGQQIKLTH